MRLKSMAALAAVLLLAGNAFAQDGRAAFEHRRDTMKAMGRALYLGVGRVANSGLTPWPRRRHLRNWPRRSARCSRLDRMFRTAT